MNRSKSIIITGIVGIIVNVLLAGFKYFVGLVAHSVSMMADATNNFSDAMSSLITIIGARLAGKEPDKKHPFGYGRIENISTLFISLLIIYAGLQAFGESLQKLLEPETPEHGFMSVTVIVVALAVKFLLAIFTKSRGKKLDSDSLVASGQDALNDCLLSSAILASALIYMNTGLNLESYLGIIISIFILKSGIEVLRDTISGILGERVTPELSADVKNVIASFPDVKGVNDLIINSYGVDKLIGSVHIEVPDVMRAAWLDNLERKITDKVYQETGVIMTGISIYAVDTEKEESVNAYKKIKEMVEAQPGIIEFHGFYIDYVDNVIRFDVIYDFDEKFKERKVEELRRQVSEAFPGYVVSITLDYDFSD